MASQSAQGYVYAYVPYARLVTGQHSRTFIKGFYCVITCTVTEDMEHQISRLKYLMCVGICVGIIPIVLSVATMIMMAIYLTDRENASNNLEQMINTALANALAGYTNTQRSLVSDSYLENVYGLPNTTDTWKICSCIEMAKTK